MRANHPVLGLTARSVVLAGLFAVFGWLLLRTELYATTIVIGAIAAILIADMVSVASRCIPNGVKSVANPERAASAGRIQALEALLDTVPAALIGVRSDGAVELMNHAARLLARVPVARLHEIEAFGPDIVPVLQSLPPGARQILKLRDGLPVHLSVLEFRVPGREPDRLLALQKIAGELDAVEIKAWQDVSSVLTHEIMNSLTPIASLSESLECLLRAPSTLATQSERNDEITGALEAIKRRSHRLMSFVERYRAVAEIPEPNVRPIDAAEFFAGIDRLMSAAFKERGVEYGSHVEEPGLQFTADAELIEQAVINLLRNAADAAAALSSNQVPRVRATCRSGAAEIVISVSDNGPGLREDEKDRLFVPFFTTKPGGKGIGLSLARHVALAHDGRIEVQSDRATGTVFSLVLPASPRGQ